MDQQVSHQPAAADVRAPLPREYLTFRLGAEEYGIDILKVQEIRGYEASTHMANAPAYIKGVLNLRGVIVPILDMRIKFGMARAEYKPETVTIVLTVANRVIGMVVDSVSDVIALQAHEIKPAPNFNSTVDTAYIIGIGSLQQGDVDRMLILMDIEQLMSSADMGLVPASIQ